MLEEGRSGWDTVRPAFHKGARVTQSRTPVAGFRGSVGGEWETDGLPAPAPPPPNPEHCKRGRRNDPDNHRGPPRRRAPQVRLSSLTLRARVSLESLTYAVRRPLGQARRLAGRGDGVLVASQQRFHQVNAVIAVQQGGGNACGLVHAHP